MYHLLGYWNVCKSERWVIVLQGQEETFTVWCWIWGDHSIHPLHEFKKKSLWPALFCSKVVSQSSLFLLWQGAKGGLKSRSYHLMKKCQKGDKWRLFQNFSPYFDTPVKSTSVCDQKQTGKALLFCNQRRANILISTELTSLMTSMCFSVSNT